MEEGDLLAALREPAAILRGRQVRFNAAWEERRLPRTARDVDTFFLRGTPRDQPYRFESEWGIAEVGPLADATLVRIVRPLDARSFLEAPEYRAFFDVSKDGIFIYDDAARLVDLNPAACALHGWTREEMLEMDPGEFIHESTHNVFVDMMATLAIAPSFTGLARGKRSDGSTFDVEVYAVPLRFRGMRLYLSSVRDVTHLRDATRAIERSEARVRRALEASDAAYWELNLETGAVFESPRCRELFGQKITGLDGWLSMGHPDDKKHLASEWQHHLARLTPRAHVERRFGEGNDQRWLDEHAVVFEGDADGNPVRVAGSARDITARKQLEARLTNGVRLEALGRMSGAIAHDFNNLLTVILSGAEMARFSLPPESPALEDIDSVVDGANRARRLTEQLLTFSRHGAPRAPALSIARELATLTPMLERLLPEQVELRVEIADDLGAIEASPAQLEQVLMNLVVNAVGAMPSGGRLLIAADDVVIDRSYVDAHPGASIGAHVRLLVRDTGVGMTDFVRARVFEPFFTTKARADGTGLGLATVYGIVQQSGGHVWVESKLDVGTTFSIYFPRSSDAATEAPPPTRVEALPLRSTGRLLVVEDDDEVRSVAVQGLLRFGYGVRSARGVEEALRVFDEAPDQFDMIVTDVMLGDGDGRALSTALRERQPELRILLVSGYTAREVFALTPDDDHLEFLAKPYAPSDLARRVKAILEGAPRPG